MLLAVLCVGQIVRHSQLWLRGSAAAEIVPDPVRPLLPQPKKAKTAVHPRQPAQAWGSLQSQKPTGVPPSGPAAVQKRTRGGTLALQETKLAARASVGNPKAHGADKKSATNNRMATLSASTLDLPQAGAGSISSSQHDEYAWDPKGYVFGLACQGRFGNQLDYMLTTMDVAKKLDRTLILAPFIVKICALAHAPSMSKAAKDVERFIQFPLPELFI